MVKILTKITFILSIVTLIQLNTQAQNIIVSGYVFESGNRGYLSDVVVNVLDKSSKALKATVRSDKDGHFSFEVPKNKTYLMQASKSVFEPTETEFTSSGVESGKKKFVEIKMTRKPGYKFEVTLAPKRENEDIVVEGIKGAWVEVFNNTTQKEIINEKDYPYKEFNVHFEQGNHYTLMVRKDGFFNKRMEAYVNVEGCILCFDGIGSVRPGVVDNLTEGNKFGVLLANVEMEPLFSGRKFEIENIYYDFGKATLRPEAKVALKSLATVLLDNPHVKVELGSHTDARDTDEFNLELSQDRAKSAVDYLVNELGVNRNNIIDTGYGETQLVNKCRDGVKCSEEEHQKNRRTEIKILNINSSKKLEKPLAQIRREEIFKEKILNEGTETIEYTSEESNEKQETIESSKEVKKNIKEVEPVKQAIAESSQDVSEVVKQKTLNKYTGFRIVLLETNSPGLPKEAKIFSQITEYTPADNKYIYLVGKFNTKEEASNYLNENIVHIFKDAYIVQLNNGKRVK